MSDVEAEHAELLKLDRLEWLRDVHTLLYARELDEPGFLTDWQVMYLHASMKSCVESILKVDLPT